MSYLTELRSPDTQNGPSPSADDHGVVLDVDPPIAAGSVHKHITG